MIKTILVTGGAGFIGSYIIEKLIEKNLNVILLEKNLTNLWRLESLKTRLTLYDSSTELSNIFNKHDIDCVIHLATYYKKDHTSSDIKKIIETNILFPTHILEEMIKHGTKYFINTGSFFEFSLNKKEPIDEKSEKQAYNFYATSKISFNEILKYYANKHKIKTIDLKLFAPYGPKDNEKLVVLLTRRLISNKVIEISKGEQQWNWTYVKDIADAYLKSLEYMQKMEEYYESFNIGSNKTASIKEIVQILEELSQKKDLIKPIKEYREDEIMYINCSNNKAKRLLKWTPQYSITEGLKETYSYYLNVGDKNG